MDSLNYFLHNEFYNITFKDYELANVILWVSETLCSIINLNHLGYKSVTLGICASFYFVEKTIKEIRITWVIASPADEINNLKKQLLNYQEQEHYNIELDIVDLDNFKQRVEKENFEKVNIIWTEDRREEGEFDLCYNFIENKKIEIEKVCRIRSQVCDIEPVLIPGKISKENRMLITYNEISQKFNGEIKNIYNYFVK